MMSKSGYATITSASEGQQSPTPTNTNSAAPPIDPIHFGTDGWRAIIGEDFNSHSLGRVADAAARVFRNHHPAREDGRDTIVVGYDCRLNAGRYAALAATVLASHGFDVVISDRYCPTPALCWTIARDPSAVGGLMLTSSHNPAEYLGVKLRMADGGASPASFTDEVEAALTDEPPAVMDAALASFELASNGTPLSPAKAAGQGHDLRFSDIMTPYLDALVGLVDAEVIAAAKLRVVVDPLFGAGRGYLAGLLGSEAMSVEVVEVNGAEDPSFNGLHPEPIPPWVEVGAREVARLGYDACFVTDGDGDRIGALDGQGNYVSSHRILALLIAHLVEDRDQRGRVVRTQAGSNLLRRQCKRLGLELVTRPIGFKWIYGEMLAGDVLIGGEESGGIGIPTHVRERDGLLAALMLTELMALKGKGLRELVEDMLEELGTLEYARRDLRLTIEQKELLLTTHVKVSPDEHNDASYGELFGHLGEELSSIDRSDGIKFEFSSDAWLLVRPSGTEPLVRVYAEAATTERVAELLDLGCALARAEIALG